jgi:hypothetical protein
MSALPELNSHDVVRIRDVTRDAICALLSQYRLELKVVPDGAGIEGSYWGAPEAGLVGQRVYVRSDTPIHSLLHESCHAICMSPERRAALHRDAGGDDLEECAVCYLQILLADCLVEVGKQRIMRDMDAWGYSFRLGNTARWFEHDSDDARQWLQTAGLITPQGRVRSGATTR